MKNGLTLNIFSDLATPHNNTLVRELKSRVEVRTWYAYERLPGVVGGECYAHVHGESRIFGGRWIHPGALWHVLCHPEEEVVLVGWSNPTTRGLILLLSLLGRRFAYWSDHPVPRRRSFLKRWGHRVYLALLARRARPFFAVGRRAVEHFEELGIPRRHLVNLPVFIDVDLKKEDFAGQIDRRRKAFGVGEGELFLTSGSRFLYEKGFDVLLAALGELRRRGKGSWKLLLVGQGPEEERLRRQIDEEGLAGAVIVEGWMSPEGFTAAIAASDVHVHPARFDAYGGGTLHAMALGVPVVGSRGAGSARDRIDDGVDGLLYAGNSPGELARCLERLLDDPRLLCQMGRTARRKAERWTPARGAEILLKGLRDHA